MRGFIDGEYQDGELRGLVFVSGKRGMGKTTELARLISLCKGNVLFYDRKAKHAHLVKGFTLATQPSEVKSLIRRGVKRILYQPRIGGAVSHFEAVNAILLAVGEAVGGFIYAVDEIDSVCKVDDEGKGVAMPPMLGEIVEYGRHHWLSMIFTARKPPRVPRGLTSECGESRIFRTTENRYVNYWAEELGDSGHAEALRKLAKGEYLLARDGDDPQILNRGVVVKVSS